MYTIMSVLDILYINRCTLFYNGVILIVDIV